MTIRRQPIGDPRVGVAYVRASTNDQRLSADAQRDTIGRWARAQGVTVVAWQCDQGVSGACDVADRPGLAAALADLRELRAGVLIVARRDRLARDCAIAIAIERAARSAGARVVAADGVANGDSPADELLRRILDAASEYERALIRARTRAALAAKRAKGERAGTVPYGFALARNGKTLIEHPGERVTLALVRELRAGGVSVRGIVAECARRGIVSRSGKPYGKSQIERMLRRTAG
jgi:DNA invertase Pin-like site-specific DNA recombinase